MKLEPLTLISPKIQASEIFPALELIMSYQALDEAIALRPKAIVLSSLLSIVGCQCLSNSILSNK